MWHSLVIASAVLLALHAIVVALVSRVRPRGNIYVTIVLVSVLTAPLGLLVGTHHQGAAWLTAGCMGADPSGAQRL